MEYLNYLTVWCWLVLGIIFLGIELVFSRGYFFCLSLVAGLVGLLQTLFPALGGVAQLGIFVSVALLVEWLWFKILRGRAILRRPSQDNYNIAKEAVGKTLVLQKPVKNHRSKVLLEGRIWHVRCKESLQAGVKVKVIGYDGVVLLCEKV